MKIATWNVNSLRVRLPHVLQWLASEQPDVLCLQELKMPTEEFPFDALRTAGYSSIVNGQKTYNGVAILSRFECLEITPNFPELEDPQRRVLAVTINGIRFINLYVPNGESLTSQKYQYKLHWLQHLKLYLQAELKKFPRMIMVGDFNIAPDEIDVHDPIVWQGRVLVSEEERSLLREILSLGFQDCFRMKNPEEKSFSWWDYRLYAFKRNLGLRIDHIFVSQALGSECQKCVIDKNPRGWERPSDHAPVILELSS